VNCEASTFYAVNAASNVSHTVNAEANTLCNNVVDNEVKTSSSKTLYDFSLLRVVYIFWSWDDVDSFLKTYSQYHRFAIIKKKVEQRDNSTIKHSSFGYEFEKSIYPKKVLISMFTLINSQNSKDVN
ncbi:16017_t:CDS:2, partial [Racocetra persica]